MDAHGGGLHIFWFPLLALFWLVAVPKIRQALRRHAAPRAASPGTPAPGDDGVALAILRERFARGEIDRAEYEERRNTLLRQFPGDTASWPA
jgi:putative membrane protein